MQQVCHILPLNGYLHRIEKHPTGECPWCPGERESQMHFHCECNEFESNRTGAHHAIARAVISSLREHNPKGWKFWYETPFSQLPFTFEWESAEEEAEQQNRRPDGVAYNEIERTVIFLEFSRPMDQERNLYAAQHRKSTQYEAAERALRRAERRTPYLQRAIRDASSIPVVVGVRGSVLYDQIFPALSVFKLSKRRTDKVIAAGIRAAITAASEMIAARTAALPSAPHRGRQAYRARPHRDNGWRADRGVT